MTLRFKIVNVDMDGACGRENHPSQSDEGLVVTPVKMITVIWSEDHEDEPGGIDDFDETKPRHIAAALNTAVDGHARTTNDIIVSSWRCITPDGRVLDLMDYEVELASAESL